MSQPSQPPAQAIRPVYVVSTQVHKDKIPDDPQVGDRIAGILLSGKQNSPSYVYVVCEDINLNSSWSNTKVGCGKKRWVQYKKIEPLRRLCAPCSILKHKSI